MFTESERNYKHKEIVIMKDYNCCVFIARMQPPHAAHIRLIKQALNTADKVVIILGSHRAASDIKNPWSADERKEMVLSCFSDEEQQRIEICPVRDQPYNNTNWMAEVQQKVVANAGGDKTALFGHKKDKSSFYLDFFPQWDLIDPGHQMQGLNATDIRTQLFEEPKEGKVWKDRGWRDCVHPRVKDYLEGFMKTDRFAELAESYEFIKNYRASWEVAPYPVTFVTTDTVVVKSGHILLVKRKGNPGKDLYALPGGHLNANELIVDGAVRELKEETRIAIQKKDLKNKIVDTHVFDHPNRDPRGRTVTHAYYIKLPDGGELPKVKGSDDAKGAYWIPLGEIPFLENQFFSDHIEIIRHFTR